MNETKNTYENILYQHLKTSMWFLNLRYSHVIPTKDFRGNERRILYHEADIEKVNNWLIWLTAQADVPLWSITPYDIHFEMQWCICLCFKRRRMCLCLHLYLLVFRFRLSRWIFRLCGDLNLLVKLWPFRMTVWVWHKPQMMKRGIGWPFLVPFRPPPVAHVDRYWDSGHEMIKYPKRSNCISEK